MEHYSPLPFAILAGFLGGVLLAVGILTTGGSFWLALAGYSFGGALTMILTAVLLSLRSAPQLDEHT